MKTVIVKKQKPSDNELMVKSYDDIVPFLEKEAENNRLLMVNSFFESIDGLEKSKNCLKSAKNTAVNIANAAVIAQQAANSEPHLEAILTPEMHKALKDGSAKIYNSHRDGKFFPKIRYNKKEEFIRLDRIVDPQAVANIALMANQMMMQQQLNEIQDTLLDLSKTVNEEFANIRHEIHAGKIDQVETAKLEFNTYMIHGESYRNQVLSHLNEAFPGLKREMIEKLKELKESSDKILNGLKSKKIKEEMKKEEENIQYIIEDLINLQVLCNIELYMAYEDRKKEIIQFVQKKYADALIEIFTEDRLELLNGLNRGTRNIWSENFIPGIKNIKGNQLEVLECQRNVQESIMVRQ